MGHGSIHRSDDPVNTAPATTRRRCRAAVRVRSLNCIHTDSVSVMLCACPLHAARVMHHASSVAHHASRTTHQASRIARATNYTHHAPHASRSHTSRTNGSRKHASHASRTSAQHGTARVRTRVRHGHAHKHGHGPGTAHHAWARARNAVMNYTADLCQQ